MYRDSVTALDEHDRAVGSILIGEALIATCDRATEVLRAPTTGAAQERWRAVADVHDAYPEIWRYLDRARRELAARGENTAAYDELRPVARRAATASGNETGEPAIDPNAIDDAKRAVAELKLAVPGADWLAIERRTQGLVRAPLARARRQRLAIGGVAMAFVLAATTWLLALVPDHKPARAEVLRRELQEIVQQRRVQIERISATLGARCDLPLARELTRLLAMDGRGRDAHGFATDYATRCGDDDIVAKWANAPLQHH